MLFLTTLLLAFALLGNTILWVGFGNRAHAVGLPRKVVKGLTLLSYVALLGIPALVAMHLGPNLAAGSDPTPWYRQAPWHWQWNLAVAYVGFSILVAAVQLPIWARQRLRDGQLPPHVRMKTQCVVDMLATLGSSPARGPRARLFASLPFNDLWQLHIVEAEVDLPTLPPALEGLSICHLSDLHLCGRIAPEYFHEVARQTNRLACDLVVLTGDVCDFEPYIGWLPEILSPIRATRGKYYILGNHDLRTKAVDRLRGVMRDSGFIDVAGRLESPAGLPLAISGNERPWFHHAEPDLSQLPAETFKLLLSHSPDQWARAQAAGYDLVLAGHTHGGQIRFPIIGPVVCPSMYGVRYSQGFFQGPRSTMFVSRGTASLFPARLNCPPEIVRLVLKRAGA